MLDLVVPYLVQFLIIYNVMQLFRKGVSGKTTGEKQTTMTNNSLLSSVTLIMKRWPPAPIPMLTLFPTVS